MPLRPFHSPGGGFEYRLKVALLLAGGALLAVLLLQLLLPWLLVGGLIGAGVWGWQRRRARALALHQVFYAQIAAHQGRISVLDFAIAAQLTGSEARQFLDQRAKDFWGDFEPTPAGDILYTFRSWQGASVAPAVLSLAAADLAQRLGCTAADLAHRRTAPDFADWSQQRDPDGCGWQYDPAGDRYWPTV